jgi:hypothetical protein
MARMHVNRIRPDLRVTLNKEGSKEPGLIIERRLTRRSKTVISLKADEWQELVDWVRAISLLSKEKQII